MPTSAYPKCHRTWSEHQYQTPEIVSPKIIPVHGKFGSSDERSNLKAFFGGALHSLLNVKLADDAIVWVAWGYFVNIDVNPPTSAKPNGKEQQTFTSYRWTVNDYKDALYLTSFNYYFVSLKLLTKMHAVLVSWL